MEYITLDTLHPRYVLAVYGSDDRDNFYIEQHEITCGQMSAGRPLARKTLLKIAHAILGQNKSQQQIGFRGLCPDKLITFSAQDNDIKLLWQVTARPRRMYFTDSLNIPNGIAEQPNLIFYLNGDGLKVFATKESTLDFDTPLYLAPFHNIDDDGEVCLGTAKPPTSQYSTKAISQAMARWKTYLNPIFTFFGRTLSRLNALIRTMDICRVNDIENWPT